MNTNFQFSLNLIFLQGIETNFALGYDDILAVYQQYSKNIFPVWLRNRLISAGLEPVLIHTEKLCIASYYIQFYTGLKMYNHNIKNSFVSPCLCHLNANKTGFNPITVQFYIRGKLFIIR